MWSSTHIDYAYSSVKVKSDKLTCYRSYSLEFNIDLKKNLPVSNRNE